MRRIWVPQALVTLLLLGALNQTNPYAYYIVLRWICCAAFAYLAIEARARRREGWVWVLGVTAAIYNPLVPLHLGRAIWTVVNLATVGIAVASVFALKSAPSETWRAAPPAGD